MGSWKEIRNGWDDNVSLPAGLKMGFCLKSKHMDGLEWIFNEIPFDNEFIIHLINSQKISNCHSSQQM